MEPTVEVRARQDMMKQSEEEDNFKCDEYHKINKTGNVTWGKDRLLELERLGHRHVSCGLKMVGDLSCASGFSFLFYSQHLK